MASPRSDAETPPEDVEAEVLDAVKAALAADGYADLTTKRIAAEFDKSESLLYHYYDSKEDLVVAFLESTTDWFAERIADIDAGDPVEQLTRLCWLLSSDFEDDRYRDLYLASLEIAAHGPHNDRFREPMVAFQEFIVDRIADVVDRGVELGYFRPVDPWGTAVVLQGLCSSAAYQEIVLGRTDAAEALREGIMDYVDWVLLAESPPPSA